MLHIAECQFYITDLCGLSCQHCVSYNDHLWGSHLHCDSQALDQWSRVMSPALISVLGGEPLSHPQLSQWLSAVAQSWPHSSRWITTNGQALLRDSLPVDSWLAGGWNLEITTHIDSVAQSLRQWLSGHSWVRAPSNTTDIGQPHSELWLRGAAATVLTDQPWFHPQPWHQRQGAWHWPGPRQQPELQHQLCPARDCRYWVQGRLYTCAQTALLPRIHGGIATPWVRDLAVDTGLSLEDLAVAQRVHSLSQPQAQCATCDWGPSEGVPVVQQRKIWIKPQATTAATAVESPPSPGDDVEPPSSSS